MSTDLVPLDDYTSELDRLADPGEFIIASVDRAKHWLAQALAHGDIERIIEIKSQAEAIRIYSMSKELGKDAVLSATEIVRRAERSLYAAVEQGRQTGEILRPGQTVRRPGHQVADADPVKTLADVGVDKYELAAVRPLKEGVPDEVFDDAIASAMADENLSRANVIRRAMKEEKKVTAPTRAQIAGAGAQRRALTGACTTLAGIAHGLRQIEDIHPDISSEEAAEWVGGLSEARLVLERVIKRLKERTNNDR